MKILTSEQVREADAYTIKNEPIKSINLMERAAGQLYREFIRNFTKSHPVDIYAGPGNNGGDGIALSRMLSLKGYRVNLYIMETGRGLSGDPEINYKRLPEIKNLSVGWLSNKNHLPRHETNSIIVDALFGSGLDRPLEGYPARLVEHINKAPNVKISVDIPSGLFAESNPDPSDTAIIMADHTWCFQFPKLSFLMPENEKYVGEWKYLDIGLHKGFIDNCDTPYHYLTIETIKKILHKRARFSHKGHFGHAFLIAGGRGKLGASVLSAEACLRSGAGLLTVHTPTIGMEVLQTALPEAMLSIDPNLDVIGTMPDVNPYTAIGAGPGLGTSKKTADSIRQLLEINRPMVLDADVLNILSQDKTLVDKIPHGTIITPHPGEYNRLYGHDSDHFSRLMRMRDISRGQKIVIVLKGANTAIADTEGNIWFNSTGNPGMATGGSGDVLTGIILSLLTQGYDPLEAALAGVFIHGLAGDLARDEKGEESLIAGDIIEWLPDAFKICKK